LRSRSHRRSAVRSRGKLRVRLFRTSPERYDLLTDSKNWGGPLFAIGYPCLWSVMTLLLHLKAGFEL